MLRKLLMSAASSLEPRGRRADRFVRLLNMEMASGTATSPWQRLRSLRQGFLSESQLLYDLSPERRHLYLSDYERTVRTPDINGKYRILLKDKLLFNLMTQQFPDIHIPTHGVINKGRVEFVAGQAQVDAAAYLSGLLDQEGALVLKPVVGGGGAQIRFVERRDDGLYVNEESLSEDAFRELVQELRSNLISNRVSQCAEFAALYPRTTNTLRILTMWDRELGEPFIAFALLRIGSEASYPVDNWTQGGIGAAIDIETGHASKGASYLRKKHQLTWHETHPDSGTQVEGFVVPHWKLVVERVLHVARSVPYLPYVGWDAIVTADGLKLLEGNHFPDVNLLQVHGPLLTNKRIADFYKAHGVIRA